MHHTNANLQQSEEDERENKGENPESELAIAAGNVSGFDGTGV